MAIAFMLPIRARASRRSSPGQAGTVRGVSPFRGVGVRSQGTHWGKETATTPTMKKHRAARRRQGKLSPSGSSSALVPVSEGSDSGTRIVELVRAIITNYREMRKASSELQRQSAFLYLDKFEFEPAIPEAFRWYLHHRLRSSLEDTHPMQGRNVVLFASRRTSLPQEALNLVQQFIAES